MASTSNEANAARWARRDLLGRRLVAIGGLGTALVVILPALLMALIGIGMFFTAGDGGGFLPCDTECGNTGLLLAAGALAVALAMAVIVRKAALGGTIALLLSGIIGAIIAAWIVPGLAQEFEYDRAPGTPFAVLLMAIILAGGLLALGAAMRLIVRLKT